MDVESVESFEETLKYQGDTSAADRCLAVKFSLEEVPDPVATATAGRPMFKTLEFCEIRVPGDKDSIVKDRVKSMDPDPRQRFPQAYAKFKAREENQHVGTPLSEWTGITRSNAKSYALMGIYTVEQLAGLADNHAQSMFGSIAHRQAARDFLAKSAGEAPLTQARAEMEVMRQQMRAMQDQLRDAGISVDVKIPEAPKRKPGRPRKDAQE